MIELTLDNPLPIGTFITAKRKKQRGSGTALTHGNVYRIVGYTTPQNGYRWDYVVEFVRSIIKETTQIDLDDQPIDDRFPFPTWGIKHSYLEVILDQNDIEFHKR